MMDKLSKILEKKKSMGKGELSDTEKDAKLSVVRAMKDKASEMMGDHLKGLKKVSVMSDSEDGIVKGLDKAKAILGDSPHNEEHADPMEGAKEEDIASDGDGSSPDEESAEHEMEESPAEEESEHEDMDEDEINRKIEELMSLKAKKSKK